MSLTSRPGHTHPPLPAWLRAYARGVHPPEAGVELLIPHSSWLRRDDLVDLFLHTETSIIDGSALASIDWTGAIAALDAGERASSSGEQRMLRLAASIADGTQVSLCDALTGLDPRNTSLVVTAVLNVSAQRASTATPMIAPSSSEKMNATPRTWPACCGWGRLPEAWIAPPPTRELRELVLHRAKLVGSRSGFKAQVHGVLARCGIHVRIADLFGVTGTELLDELDLPGVFPTRVASLRSQIPRSRQREATWLRSRWTKGRARGGRNLDWLGVM